MPRSCGVVVLLALLLSPPALAQPPPDPWFAPDKALHFTATTLISGTGYGLSALATDKRWLRAVIGFGSAVAIGAAKETRDALGYGDPSWKDMTWNAIGAATGMLIAWGIDRLVSGPAPPSSASCRYPTTLSF